MISRRRLLMTASSTALAIGLAPALTWAEPQRGGDVIVGIRSAIPSLDIMATTDDIGRIINLHLYEALVTRDENLQPSAGLAESWTVSDDGLRYTFELRQGVMFHNGKEMTSADVKASIDRFIRMALRKNYLANVTEVRATGPYTVEVQLGEPQPLFLDNFSQPEVLVAILPEEDGNAEPSATSLIGTGPYKLAENVADSHIRLDRFDDYALDTRYTGTDGYGGRKDALFDSLTFRIIPEPSAMVAALEAGEIHLADLVPETAVPRLQDNPAIEVFVKMPTAMNSITMNLAQPPMDNLDFRKAIMVALDFDELLDAAADGNYQLNPYMQYPGYPTYPESVTAPLYNAKDLDLARELVAQSGYDGRPIVIMSATTYTWSSNTALVVSEKLKEIGVNVEIDVMDWPAVVSRRSSPEGWHLNPGQFGTGPWLGDPVLSIGALGTPNSANHKEDPYLVGLLSDMQLKPTEDERKAAWLEAQQYILDEVLTLKLGDVGLTQAASREITGFMPFRTTRLWNVGFV